MTRTADEITEILDNAGHFLVSCKLESDADFAVWLLALKNLELTKLSQVANCQQRQIFLNLDPMQQESQYSTFIAVWGQRNESSDNTPRPKRFRKLNLP